MRALATLALTSFFALVMIVPAHLDVQDAGHGPVDPLKLAGYAEYTKHCAPCHGERGDGKGVAARFLDPAPRDFKNEAFRLVSTANGVPSAKDLFETAATGIGGTAMIPFASIGEDVLWQIVEVVDAFRVAGLRERLSAGGLDPAAVAAEVEKRHPARREDEASEPAETVETAARGLVHYRALCASCHGVDGRGVMPASAPTGQSPQRPRDLARGVLKQIPTNHNLFLRIRCGMPGSAMPGTSPSTLDAEKTWELVHYLRTLIPAGAQLLASTDGRTIDALPLDGAAPESPDDPRFAAAPRAWIAFAPFRDSEPGPPGAFVQALASDRLIVFRFVMPDTTPDVPSSATDSAPDGIAVRVSPAPKPPVLPFPGQQPRIDRALFVSGPLPDGKSAIYRAEPRFDNPENVCRMVQPPDRAGAGVHKDGAWHVVLAVRTEESGSTRGATPLSVSFAPFDGALRRGPMPVGFSAWHRLVVK